MRCFDRHWRTKCLAIGRDCQGHDVEQRYLCLLDIVSVSVTLPHSTSSGQFCRPRLHRGDLDTAEDHKRAIGTIYDANVIKNVKFPNMFLRGHQY